MPNYLADMMQSGDNGGGRNYLQDYETPYVPTYAVSSANYLGDLVNRADESLYSHNAMDNPLFFLGTTDIPKVGANALQGVEQLSRLPSNAGRIMEHRIQGTTPQELPWELGQIGTAKAKNPYRNPELNVALPDDEIRNSLLNTPTQQSESIMSRLQGDPRAQEIFKWHGDKGRNQSAIHHNEKTGFSVDFSTTCPNKCSGVGPCLYCYVEHPRVQNALKEAGEDPIKKASTSGKKFVEQPYRGEIKTWPDSLISAVNQDGGLRMFSFGDFRPDIDDANVASLLEDAAAKGLYVKAITKSPELVRRFGDNPNLRVNLSTDLVPPELTRGVPINEAVALRDQYPNVKVRGVALNKEEALKMSQDPNIDVVTLYHGLTNFNPDGSRSDALLQIVMEQNPDAAKRMGGVDKLRDYLDTWENIGSPQSSFRKDLLKNYGPKICCGGGKCAKDPTKCGFNGGVTGAVLAGVSLPWFTHEED